MRLYIRLAVICLCFSSLLLAPGPCFAQTPAQTTLSQAEPMPPWIVPVLKLVSATHVEPTTGVVLSDSGLVLVPSNFASVGDEIIVLDGGTDIIRNGRPAKILQRFPMEGLQVLSVKAFHRQSAGFSPAPLTDGGEVRLSAFPPAEMIAEGAPPLDIPVKVTIPVENGKPVISGVNPLPNVTGPLLDDCGQLAGYSAANGVQSMSTSEAPGYQWKETLIRLMTELQLEPRIADCSTPAAGPNEEALPEEEEAVPEPTDSIQDAKPEAEPEDNPEPAALPEPETADPIAEEPAEEPAGEADLPVEEESLLELETLPPYEDEAPIDATTDQEEDKPLPLEENGASAWLWLLGAILLIGGGIALHRIRSTKSEDSMADEMPPSNQEQAAGELEETSSGHMTPGLDACLVISGQLTEGTPVEARCDVSSMAINLLLGRGNADLVIDSPAVSRRHARINGSANALTISDLGSSNGTSINGIPCLEGETMYIEPGDTIILGNARINYQVIAASSTDSQAQE